MKCQVACVQMNSTDKPAENTATILATMQQAAGKGAKLIAFPENALCMRAPGDKNLPPSAEHIEKIKQQAAKLGVWALIGSVQMPAENGKAYNRSLLINAEGQEVAQYDKIHLFDVTLGNGEHYAESDRIAPGDKAVYAETAWGKLGLTVCYDVRFPQLYRALAKQGASILSVPAAFTYTTGTAHWHVLLRARAIETGCYIIAPAQCGLHAGNRRTYGHSIIIGPWGEVLAEAGESETGIIYATLDLSKVDEARAMVPSLQHDREFA